MTANGNTDPPRRDGSGDAAGDFDDDFLDADVSARRRLATPALLLIVATTITGAPVVALFLLAVVYYLLTGHAETVAGYVTVGFLLTVYFSVLLRGSLQMRRFGSLSQALAAVRWGVASVVILPGIGVLILACAVWAWVVLRDPLVKKQFRSP